MKYIIEEELYDKISTILCNYDSLLERLGEEFRNSTLEDDWNSLGKVLNEYDALPTYEGKTIPEEKKEHVLTVGDYVRVVDSGESYTTYSEWIEKYITEPSERYLWDYGVTRYEGEVGKILFIAPHDCGHTNLAYVKMDNGRCYLIGVKGLEKI